MQVLILQSSPRANGNTAWMAEEFKKAAEAAGHKVTLVNVSKKKIAGCLACEYCHNKGNGACIQKDDMQELYPLIAEAEALVLAAPIYYFTLNAQIQAPIQRMYCVNKPAKVKKMALLVSSYSPGVYDGATAEFRDICNYWSTENMGVVTAKIDEQKTEETRQKVVALAEKLYTVIKEQRRTGSTAQAADGQQGLSHHGISDTLHGPLLSGCAYWHHPWLG